MQLIVLAGDSSEYYSAKREGRLPFDVDIVYVGSVEGAKQLVQCGDKIIIIGRFWNRRDAREIYDIVKARAEGIRGPWLRDEIQSQGPGWQLLYRPATDELFLRMTGINIDYAIAQGTTDYVISQVENFLARNGLRMNVTVPDKTARRDGPQAKFVLRIVPGRKGHAGASAVGGALDGGGGSPVPEEK